MERSSKVSFAGGMWVFPGGKVDPDDAADAAGTGGAGDDAEAVLRRTAVREAAEEAGLDLDPASLVAFSHWTPPPESPSKYLTTFFVTAVTVDDVTVDGSEMVAARWLRPEAALAEHAAGAIELAPPTFITLVYLSGFAAAAELVAAFEEGPFEWFATHFLPMTSVAVYHGDIAHPTTRTDALTDADREALGPHHRLDTSQRPWVYTRDASTLPRRGGAVNSDLPAPNLTVRTEGRTVAGDIVGAVDGVPVVFWHGTPDTRFLLPPGGGPPHDWPCRVLALDRPGLGDTDAAVGTDAVDAAIADVVAVMDALGWPSAVHIGWSAGAIFAVAFATAHPERTAGTVLLAPLVTVDGVKELAVAGLVGADRLLFADAVADIGIEAAASEMAPFLVAEGLTAGDAEAIIASEHPDLVERDRIALARSMLAATQQGMVGLVGDLSAQTWTAPRDQLPGTAVVMASDDDQTCPVAMANWWAQRLGNVATIVRPGGDHLFPLKDWGEVLEAAAALANQ